MTTEIKGWRERANLKPDYEITCPTDVERALLDEIAELRKVVEAPFTHCELPNMKHLRPCTECVTEGYCKGKKDRQQARASA